MSLLLAASGAAPVSQSYASTGGLVSGGLALALHHNQTIAAGGLTAGGAALTLHRQHLAAAGGLTTGGAVSAVKRQTVTALGGLVTGGTGVVTHHQHITANGGVVSGGAAAASVRQVFAASGGLVTGGAAATASTAHVVDTYAAAGGLISGGAAAAVHVVHALSTGGLSTGGLAAIAHAQTSPAAGGLVLAGTGATSTTRPFTSAGGLATAGTAPGVVVRPFLANGGLTLGGTAPTETRPLRASYAAAGGLSLGGQAAATLVVSLVYTSTGGAVFGGAALAIAFDSTKPIPVPVQPTVGGGGGFYQSRREMLRAIAARRAFVERALERPVERFEPIGLSFTSTGGVTLGGEARAIAVHVPAWVLDASRSIARSNDRIYDATTGSTATGTAAYSRLFGDASVYRLWRNGSDRFAIRSPQTDVDRSDRDRDGHVFDSGDQFRDRKVRRSLRELSRAAHDQTASRWRDQNWAPVPPLIDDRLHDPPTLYATDPTQTYYDDVAHLLLPHLRGRPLMIKRWPHGTAHDPIYERDAPDDAPSWLRIANAPRRKGGPDHRAIVVEDLDGLRWVTSRGAVELHPYGHHADDPDYPIAVWFDLDPGTGVAFTAIVEAAQCLKAALDSWALQSFVKLSGSKGLHVAVPIARHTYADVRRFARPLVSHLARAYPDLITVKIPRAERVGKVWIDWTANGPRRTLAAPWTWRHTTGVAVSLPITWDELDDAPSSAPLDALQYAAAHDDPWADVARGLDQLLPDLVTIAADDELLGLSDEVLV